MSVPSLANQPTSFDAQTVIEYDSIPMKHTGTIRTLKSLKYVYLLLTIQLIITIGYLNYTTSKIIIMNENRESLSFKERNDFSSHSIKLLFRSRNFTMYFYMVGMFLYFIQLATLPAISLLSSTKRIMNSQFKLQQCLAFIVTLLQRLSGRTLQFLQFAYQVTYAAGQTYQLIHFDYNLELTKLRAYKQEEADTQNDDEEGDIANQSWLLLFTLSVIIVVIIKTLWLVSILRIYRWIIKMELFKVPQVMNSDDPVINP